jgi:hypothetical protein
MRLIATSEWSVYLQISVPMEVSLFEWLYADAENAIARRGRSEPSKIAKAGAADLLWLLANEGGQAPTGI